MKTFSGSSSMFAIVLSFVMGGLLVGCSCNHQVAINVLAKPTQNGNGVTGGSITITGSSFNPGSLLEISYAGIPNRPNPSPTQAGRPQVQGDGTFSFGETFNCTTDDPSEANAKVLVTVRDPKDGCFSDSNVTASKVWVCTGGNKP